MQARAPKTDREENTFMTSPVPDAQPHASEGSVSDRPHAPRTGTELEDSDGRTMGQPGAVTVVGTAEGGPRNTQVLRVT